MPDYYMQSYLRLLEGDDTETRRMLLHLSVINDLCDRFFEAHDGHTYRVMMRRVRVCQRYESEKSNER